MSEFEETSRPPTGPIWIGAGALTVGLWAVALWALISAEADPLAIPAIVVQPALAEADEAGGELPNLSTMIEAVAKATTPPKVEEPENNSRGQGRGAELLKLRFTHREKQAEVALREVFVPRTITVVNVWATWCEPCKAEFSDFAQIWQRWGEEVRFVPVELAPIFDRTSESRQTSDALRAIMPASQVHLVDPSERRIQEAVIKMGLVELDEVNVPITLVFDCKQELIWHGFSQITDLEAFAGVIEGLRPALSTAACYVPPAREAPVEVIGDGSRCGDGQCTVKTGEDCNTCSVDCACRGGQVCIQREAASLQPGSASHVCDSPSPLMP